MFGSKLLLAGSHLLVAPAPVGAHAADIKTQSSTRYLRYDAVPSSDQMLTLTAEDYFSYPTFDAQTICRTRACVTSGNRNWKGGVRSREGTRKG